jgi:hypothetical protein
MIGMSFFHRPLGSEWGDRTAPFPLPMSLCGD